MRSSRASNRCWSASILFLSSYCYLLSCEEHRDGDTWGVRLLECARAGVLTPTTSWPYGGNALRAAQAEALPDTPCRSDVFHAVAEVQKVVTKLENRAYQTLTTCVNLAKKQANFQKSNGRANGSYAKQLSDATPKQDQAIAVADDVAVLWTLALLRTILWGWPDGSPPRRPSGPVRLCLRGTDAARVDQAPELLGKANKLSQKSA